MSQEVDKVEKQKKEKTGEEEEKSEGEEQKKEPESLSEGERMGLSKQQLRKLEKKLKKKEKDKAKEKEQLKQDHKEKEKKVKKEKQQTIDEAHRLEFLSQKIHLKANTNLPQQGKENILVTSALPYVNNVPHLGNIIGCVLSADVYSRFMKLQGVNVLYICGTDQYGTATEVKALEEKKTPKEICDQYHKLHKQVYDWFDIGFDYFGRTSDPWHTKIVQSLFLEVQKHGQILQQQMTQCYCEHCDLFLADRFVIGTCPNPPCLQKKVEARGDQCDTCQKLFNNPTQLKDYLCSICKKPPVLRETRHLFLDLPKLKTQVAEWVKDTSKNWSSNSVGITNSWLEFKGGLKPKCITRDLKWGVPVPVEEFQGKVFYVWFDAPIGYISITASHLGENYAAWWQSKEVQLYQFMGKDNVPFHTVIFPASLLASKQPWTLLKSLSTTQYLTYEGGKFSKSLNRGVFGNQAAQLQKDLPAEVWRYYLLVNRPENSDSDFSWQDLALKNNNELLANLGNLVHRALQFIYHKYERKIPVLKRDILKQEDLDFITEMKNRYIKYRDMMKKVEIKESLKFSMEISSRGNKYLQDSQFWEEHHRKSGRTDLVLNIILNFIRFQSFLIEPFMPATSAKINWLLGLEHRTEFDDTLGLHLNQKSEDFIEIFLGLIEKSKQIRQPVPLFSTISQEQVKQWRQRFGGKPKEQP